MTRAVQSDDRARALRAMGAYVTPTDAERILAFFEAAADKWDQTKPTKGRRK